MTAAEAPAASAPAVLPAPAPRRAAPLRAIDGFQVHSAQEATGEKLVCADDPYLVGHYPDFTIYPGVFVIETVQQTVRALVEDTHQGRFEAELAAIGSVRFSTPVLPGDLLRAHCRCTAQDDGTLKVKADCRNQREQRTAAVTLTFRLTEAGTDA